MSRKGFLQIQGVKPDLTQVLETENLPETQEIAELLKSKTWS
jgi:hypothetical protein